MRNYILPIVICMFLLIGNAEAVIIDTGEEGINLITYFNVTTPHNDLIGLQGGASDEYYHLNDSIYTYLLANIYGWGSGGDSLWTNSSGDATYTAGRVGIGTTTPNAKLEVSTTSNEYSSIFRGGRILITDDSTPATGIGLQFGYNAGGNQSNFVSYDFGNTLWKGIQFAGSPIKFMDGPTEVMRITNNNAGIGITTPGEKLHVDGNINVTSGNDICIEGGNCLSTIGGRGWVDDGIVVRLETTTDKVGIGTTTPSAKLDVEVSSGGAMTVGSSGNTATGAYAIAMGSSTNASDSYSTAMGLNTKANAYASTAMGSATQASGMISTAMGIATKARGIASTAMGATTIADGNYALAIGEGTTASGSHAFTGGKNMQPSSGGGTFVWGNSNVAQIFSPANNRFLIFPQGDKGRVGIGTTTPASKLDVNGNVTINPDFIIGGNLLTVIGNVYSVGDRTGIMVDNKMNTQTNGYGLSSRVGVFFPGFAQTLTNGYGLYVRTPFEQVTSTVTNQYGLFIEDQDDYAIYTNKGKIYFNDSVEIGTTLQAIDYYSGDGSQGITQTISIRKGDDSGPCNLVVKDGLITSTTC